MTNTTQYTYGIGYIGEGPYETTVDRRHLPVHIKWHNMLMRCYCPLSLRNYPSYKNTSVCKEWLCFQKFAEWYYAQDCSENYHLDKDLLFNGSDIYSPSTCCLIPPEINLALISSSNCRELPPGVYRAKRKFRAKYHNKHLGSFNTPEEASASYKIAKQSHIHSLADKYKSVLEERVYSKLKSFKIK